MGSIRGGSMGKVGALELVGGYEDVSGCIEGSNENQYQDQNWAEKVGWVRGPQAKEMHLRWVKGP